MPRSLRSPQLLSVVLPCLCLHTLAACGKQNRASDASETGDAFDPRTSFSLPLNPGCANYPFIDTIADWPGLQIDCQTTIQIPCDTPGVGDCLSNGDTESAISQCIDPSMGLPLDPRTAMSHLTSIPDDSRPCWYLVDDPEACPATLWGQRMSVLEKGGAVVPPDALLSMKCLICLRSDHLCPAVGDL